MALTYATAFILDGEQISCRDWRIEVDTMYDPSLKTLLYTDLDGTEHSHVDVTVVLNEHGEKYIYSHRSLIPKPPEHHLIHSCRSPIPKATY